MDFIGLKEYEAQLRRLAGLDDSTPLTQRVEEAANRMDNSPPPGVKSGQGFKRKAGKHMDGLAAINLLAKAFGGKPIEA